MYNFRTPVALSSGKEITMLPKRPRLLAANGSGNPYETVRRGAEAILQQQAANRAECDIMGEKLAEALKLVVEQGKVISALTEEKGKLVANVSDAKKGIDRLQVTILETETIIAATDTKFRKLEQAVKQGQNDRARVMVELDEKRELFRTMKATIGQLKEDLAQKEEALEQAITTCREKEQTIALQGTRAGELRATLATEQEAKLSLQEQLGTAKAKICNLEDSQHRQTHAHENRERELEGQVRSVSEDNATLTAKVKENEAELQTLHSANTDMEASLVCMKGEVEEHQNRITDLAEKLEEASTEFVFRFQPKYCFPG
mmetsp:Transcript_9492/g.26621  ORF Transcript_9492/g.26621 Transcript_9492/m.26621 type:complete len:318 (+) Transcript_9492:151-1104(+)